MVTVGVATVVGVVFGRETNELWDWECLRGEWWAPWSPVPPDLVPPGDLFPPPLERVRSLERERERDRQTDRERETEKQRESV